MRLLAFLALSSCAPVIPTVTVACNGRTLIVADLEPGEYVDSVTYGIDAGSGLACTASLSEEGK